MNPLNQALRLGRSMAEFLSRRFDPELLAACTIVGGSLRSDRSADIDVVVDQAFWEKTDGKMPIKGKFSMTNGFGGQVWSIQRELENTMMVKLDIWPLHKNWCFTQPGVGPVCIDVMVQHTFLNVQGISYRPSTDVIVESGFSNAMSSRVLEIQYEPVPEKALLYSLRKAASLISREKFLVGRRLREMLESECPR